MADMENTKEPGDYLYKATENFIQAPLSRGADAIESAKTPMDFLENRLNISPKDLISTKNKAQEKVDTEALDTQAGLTLARLMQSDPILSEAEPDLINEIFTTLRDTDPKFVQDPARLRMALREAIQYGAIPMHTLKEMTDIRKSRAQAEDTEATSNKRKYSVRGDLE